LNSSDIQRLCEQALNARENAYAPYSTFLVGAAVLCDTGDTYSGCNIENASYGLTMCAERVALFNAVSAGNAQPIALAVATSGGHYPCGACRQVMAEFSDDLKVFIGNSDKPESPFVERTIVHLLPGRFELP
jgi:cytidine deaminase